MTLSSNEIKKRSVLLRTIKVTIVPINLIRKIPDSSLPPCAICLGELFDPDTTEPIDSHIIKNMVTSLVMENSLEQELLCRNVDTEITKFIKTYVDDGGLFTPYVLTGPNRWYSLTSQSTINAVLEQFLLYRPEDSIDPTIFIDFRNILEDRYPTHPFEPLLHAMSRYHWIDPSKYENQGRKMSTQPKNDTPTKPDVPTTTPNLKQTFAKGPPTVHPNASTSPQVQTVKVDGNTNVNSNIPSTTTSHPLFPNVNIQNLTNTQSSNLPLSNLSPQVQDKSQLCPPQHLNRDEYATYLSDISQRTVPSATKTINVTAVKYTAGTSMLSWYHRIRSFFGIQFGVYLPPVPSLDKDSIMGQEWDSGCLPPLLYSKIGSMNALLLQHLRHPDMFQSQQHKNVVEIAGDNMYVAFRNILRPYVPGLSDDHVLEEPIVEQERTTSWFTLVQRVITYCEQAAAHGRNHSRYQRLLLVLNNLHPMWRTELRRSCLADIITPRYDKDNNIPLDLYLSSLPTTLERKAKTMDIKTRFEMNLTSTETKTTPTQINQVQQTKPRCLLCDSDEHMLRACPAIKRMLDHAKAPRKASLLRHCLKPIIDSRQMNRNAIRAIETDMTTLCNSPVDLISPLSDATEGAEPTHVTPAEDMQQPHNDQDDQIKALTQDMDIDAPLFTHMSEYNIDSDSDDNVVASVVHSGVIVDASHQDDIFQNLFPAIDDNHNIKVIRAIQFHDTTHTSCENHTREHAVQIQIVQENQRKLQNVADLFVTTQKCTTHNICEHNEEDLCTTDDHNHHPYTVMTSSNNIHRIETFNHRAQVDSGADVGVCSQKHLLHEFKAFPHGHPKRTYLQDAGKNKHYIEGAGYILVPCDHGYIRFPAAFVPTIPGILINPRQHGLSNVHEESLNCNYNTKIHSYQITRTRNGQQETIKIALTVGDKESRLFTRPLLPSTDLEHANSFPQIKQIGNSDFQRTLWHNRLAHLNYRTLSTLHKHVEGIPKIQNAVHDVDNCPTCLESKLRRTKRGNSATDKDANIFGQGLALDWMFIVQQSKDETRRQRLTAHNGDTAILVVVDMYSGALKGATSSSKAPPLAWLNRHLSKIRPSRETSCFIIMDEGGELGRNSELRKICEAHQYEIRTSAPDMHNQSGMAERPIQSISNGIRSMLHSAGISSKYWNYAYYYYQEIYNRIPHGIRDKTPYELATHRKPDLTRFRTWGCRVYVRPAGERESRLTNHCNVGTFLGFTSTDSQIRYLDNRTQRIKTAAHVRFDEGMNGTSKMPQNALMLRQALGREVSAEELDTQAPAEYNIFAQSAYFPQHIVVTFNMRATDIEKNHDTLGFQIAEDIIIRRGYLFGVLPHSTASKIRGIRQKLMGAYIIEVDGSPVATKEEIDNALSATMVDRHDDLDRPIKIIFAPDKALLRNHLDQPAVLPRLHSDQLRRIAMIHESGEDSTVDNLTQQWQQDEDTLTAEELDLYVLGVTSVAVAQSKFTRTQIMNGPDKQAWLDAEWKQLDTMRKDGMYGQPISKTQCPPEADILGVVWTYLIKWNGVKKARNCCDGRPLSKRQNKALMNTYAACIGQTGLRIFVALAAMKGYTIWDLDAINAYAQSPPPSKPTYVRVDIQYRTWYNQRFGKDIPIGHVLPVLHAIQGHPEAGGLWQTKVTKDLEDIGFTNTTHEPCLYNIMFEGSHILLCRQVDDMLIATADWTKAKKIMTMISQKMNVEFGNGPSTHYNGVDMEQNKDYIAITCETYINKLLKQHGWDKPGRGEETPMEPIHPDSAKQLETESGPDIDSDEGKALATEMGYGYRAIIGELTYAYVVARLDIGCAIVLLSKHTRHPARCHYIAAKRVMRYLRQTKNRGLMYWRLKIPQNMPDCSYTPRVLEEMETSYPYTEDPFRCSLYVDAAHATCLTTRRSIAGRIVMLGGTAIAYQSKMQSVVATSSTEAEFMAAVMGAKSLLSIRSILEELGFEQKEASPIFEDNAAAIMMANQNRPTERTRHIDIQFFALQEWVQNGSVKLYHIPGTLNSADANTKPLTKKLFTRHITRSMGQLGSPYATGKYAVPATFVDQVKE